MRERGRVHVRACARECVRAGAHRVGASVCVGVCGVMSSIREQTIEYTKLHIESYDQLPVRTSVRPELHTFLIPEVNQ